MTKKKPKEIELKECVECGVKPEIEEIKLFNVWRKGKFVIAYKVVCPKCGKHTIISGSKNMVKYYWNSDQYIKKK